LPQYKEVLLAQYDDVPQIIQLYQTSIGDFFSHGGIEDAAHRAIFATAICGKGHG